MALPDFDGTASARSGCSRGDAAAGEHADEGRLGRSGWEIIERYVALLNAGATPHAYQRGSIGASGDLAPLAYIGASAIGLDPCFKIDLGGETLDSHSALAKLGLEPIELEPKEGLALNNGTTACTGVAANVMGRAYDVLALAIGAHALMAQALLATNQSFHPAIHALKPHPGQVWIAAQIARSAGGLKARAPTKRRAIAPIASAS